MKPMDNNTEVDLGIFKLMADQIRDYAFLVLDLEGRIRTWNLGAQLIKGYHADEVIGTHFSRFYTADSIASGWPEYELKVAAAEGRFEDEGWRLRKDGSRFWASVTITALRDESGTLVGFSKITRDLSERKAHDEALRQSEERFRLLIEGVVDYAIFMLNQEGIVTSWNTGAQRIKGYTPDEIIGKHFSRFYLPEDIKAAKPWHELATARQLGRAEDEGWRLKKNGEPFWARVVVTALYDRDGHLNGFAKVTQDLTERRHMQDLEKAAQNVHEFIATLAHELRNPLAPIRSAAQAMSKLPAGDPRQGTMLAMINRQSLHMAHIIDDLIDVTRIGRGILAVEDLPVDICDVIRRSMEAATPLVEARQHSVEIEWPEGPLHVRGDPNRLTQLLTNLLSNATRYTANGGSIRVIGKAEGSWAIVRVRDTGKGVEPDMTARIFDMFVQGRGTLERAERGLGIGLALARKIAVLHGGSLDVLSEGRDRGSEFTLRIPLASVITPDAEQTAGAMAPLHEVAQPSVPACVRRVLIVDDNADAAESLNALVQFLGHATCVVNDGAAALEKAEQFHPDIVLLDIGMPGLNGYEVARRLREREVEPLRIIAITGWGQDLDRVKSAAAGFDMHLLKPVELHQLTSVLSDEDPLVRPAVSA